MLRNWQSHSDYYKHYLTLDLKKSFRDSSLAVWLIPLLKWVSWVIPLNYLLPSMAHLIRLKQAITASKTVSAA
ncbi:MAG: hypothetical protein PWR01_634 [Clostridiales bacterium]|nr:hypothetical protein [Clostridiales bacterium]